MPKGEREPATPTEAAVDSNVDNGNNNYKNNYKARRDTTTRSQQLPPRRPRGDDRDDDLGDKNAATTTVTTAPILGVCQLVRVDQEDHLPHIRSEIWFLFPDDTKVPHRSHPL
jgi:hypothetical protein